MPKVNVYMKTSMTDEIRALVEEDIQAGASPAEVSFSSKACMLLELGLRVYNLRRSEQAGHSRDEFDQLLISSVLEAKLLSQFLTKTLCEEKGIAVADVKMNVKGKVKEEIERFFPTADENE